MRCAGEVDLTTTALLSLPHEPLPYPGQHETRQLHQMERVDADLGIRGLLQDGLSSTVPTG
jgi:hypothetical protein